MPLTSQQAQELGLDPELLKKFDIEAEGFHTLIKAKDQSIALVLAKPQDNTTLILEDSPLAIEAANILKAKRFGQINWHIDDGQHKKFAFGRDLSLQVADIKPVLPENFSLIVGIEEINKYIEAHYKTYSDFYRVMHYYLYLFSGYSKDKVEEAVEGKVEDKFGRFEGKYTTPVIMLNAHNIPVGSILATCYSDSNFMYVFDELVNPKLANFTFSDLRLDELEKLDALCKSGHLKDSNYVDRIKLELARFVGVSFDTEENPEESSKYLQPLFAKISQIGYQKKCDNILIRHAPGKESDQIKLDLYTKAGAAKRKENELTVIHGPATPICTKIKAQDLEEAKNHLGQRDQALLAKKNQEATPFRTATEALAGQQISSAPSND